MLRVFDLGSNHVLVVFYCSNGLEFRDNLLTGVIPDFSATVEHLDVSQNQLGGTIPSSLGIGGVLRFFDASNNTLTGGIPPEVGNWNALETFNASNNLLTGSIPVQLANAKKLSDLKVVGNSLMTGAVPDELCSLPSFGFPCSDTMCGCSCACPP